MSIQKFGLALDWETSGYSVPDYAKEHQGLAFGAIIFDISTLEPVESIYVEVKFDEKYKWDAGAERIHGLTKEHLAKNGVTQEEAAITLASLVMKYNGTEKLIFLGHRPHFDIAFTNQLLAAAELEFQYDPVKIDSAAFGTVMLGVNKSDELFSLMGFPPRQDHNALEDIMYTLDSVRLMKEFFIAGVKSSSN